MSPYRIDYSPKAVKQLRTIRDARLGTPLKRAITALATNPRPPGCVKMAGSVDLWRIRVGDWRVIYAVDDGVLVVLVVTVAPRGGVYG